MRSCTKNCGTCRASYKDENLNKLTPLWYLNVRVKYSVFALRMMSDELSSWKVALYARYRQAQSALQRLLDERGQLQQYLIDTKRQVTSLIGFTWHKSYVTYILASTSRLLYLHWHHHHHHRRHHHHHHYQHDSNNNDYKQLIIRSIHFLLKQDSYTCTYTYIAIVNQT